jgi:hypothetical protein
MFPTLHIFSVAIKSRFPELLISFFTPFLDIAEHGHAQNMNEIFADGH